MRGCWGQAACFAAVLGAAAVATPGASAPHALGSFAWAGGTGSRAPRAAEHEEFAVSALRAAAAHALSPRFCGIAAMALGIHNHVHAPRELPRAPPVTERACAVRVACSASGPHHLLLASRSPHRRPLAGRAEQQIHKAVAGLCHEHLGEHAGAALLQMFPARVSAVELPVAATLRRAQAARQLAQATFNSGDGSVGAGSVKRLSRAQAARAIVEADARATALAQARSRLPGSPLDQRDTNLSISARTHAVEAWLEAGPSGATVATTINATGSHRSSLASGGTASASHLSFIKSAFVATWFHALQAHETEAEGRVISADLALAKCNATLARLSEALKREASAGGKTHWFVAARLRGGSKELSDARSAGASLAQQLDLEEARCAKLRQAEQQARRDLADIRSERSKWKLALHDLHAELVRRRPREVNTSLLGPARRLVSLVAGLEEAVAAAAKMGSGPSGDVAGMLAAAFRLGGGSDATQRALAIALKAQTQSKPDAEVMRDKVDTALGLVGHPELARLAADDWEGDPRELVGGAEATFQQSGWLEEDRAGSAGISAALGALGFGAGPLSGFSAGRRPGVPSGAQSGSAADGETGQRSTRSGAKNPRSNEIGRAHV